jgi:hypothetical protein
MSTGLLHAGSMFVHVDDFAMCFAEVSFLKKANSLGKEDWPKVWLVLRVELLFTLMLALWFALWFIL